MFFWKNKNDHTEESHREVLELAKELKEKIKKEVKKRNKNIDHTDESIKGCINALNVFLEEFSRKTDPLRKEDKMHIHDFLRIIVDLELNYKFIRDAKRQFSHVVEIFDNVLADRKFFHDFIHETLNENSILQESMPECILCLNDKKNDEDQ